MIGAKRIRAKRIRAGRGKKRRDGLTQIQHEFLETLKQHPRGNISAVCEAMGIDRTAHYTTWKTSPLYVAAFEEIIKVIVASRKDLVMEMIQKAGDEGLEEEVVEQVQERQPDGEMVTTKQVRRMTRRPQIAALMWEGNLLWGNPSRLEGTGQGGGPIELRNRAMEELVTRLDAMAIRLNGAPKKLNGGTR